MTRAEFIAGYCARSSIKPTSYGYRTATGRDHFALPCSCGDAGCFGWKMIYLDVEPYTALEEDDVAWVRDHDGPLTVHPDGSTLVLIAKGGEASDGR